MGRCTTNLVLPFGRRRYFRLLSTVVAVGVVGGGFMLHGPTTARASSGYSAAVLADGPDVYYRLDEASGNGVRDISGNGNNGTYVGSPTYGVGGATNDGDTAVSFPLNSNSWVDSNYRPAALNAFSLTAWVYVPGPHPGDTSVAASSNVATSNKGFNWVFETDNTSDIIFQTTGTGLITSPDLPAISTNAWHQTALTYDGSKVCGYIDGRQQWCAAASGQMPADTANTMLLGATPNVAGTGSGLEIDEFAFYTHALTAARVLTQYESRTPSVSGISPSNGPITGGTSVSISGAALSGATAVSFGGRAASSFTVNSDTSITATSPAGALPGAVDVTVTTPGGTTATSSADQFTYTLFPTSTALPLSSNNPSTYSQAVTFSTTVTGTGPMPTGTVTWKDGASTLATSSLDASGNASYTTSVLAGGSHSITAVYGGDYSHSGSTSSSLTQVVNVATPSVSTPSAAPNPSTHGQTVTFSLTVTGSGATPTGNVTWYDGSTALATTSLSGGAASLTTAALNAGSHSISAQYSGDGNYAGAASGAVTQGVNKATTSTALASAPNPSTAGQSVTFTATVSAVAPGAGTPTGTVTFSDSGVAFGTAALDTSGVATLSAAETGGVHTITATYGGDSNNLTSTSSPVTQTVNQASSSVSSPSSSANPTSYGSPVTLSVTVSGPGFPPSGTVVFYDGSTPIGTATVGPTGVATLMTSALTGGTHTITAIYNGDVNNTSSTSGVLTLTVTTATPVVNATSSNNPSTFDDSVTFTATLSGAGLTPTGTVMWMDGSLLLGTSTVDNSGMTSLSLSTLSAGAHNVSAVYSGDQNYASATSQTVSQTVNQAAVTLSTPTSSRNPSLSGQAVTFTTHLTPTDSVGTVTWMDGSTPLGSSPVMTGGVATFSTTLPAGTHGIAAVYSGDANHLSATSAVMIQRVYSPIQSQPSHHSTTVPPPSQPGKPTNNSTPPTPKPAPATRHHAAGGKQPPASNVTPSALPWWARIGSEVVLRSAFPLLLIILALLFLSIQDRIDRKDPKLALAPARPDPQLPFPAPRGNP